jgi:hypothetical protein
MSKFKFTPGPWESFNDDSDHQPVCFVGESNIDNKGYEVGQRHTQMHEGDSKYDAKLISCAPEMLEALIQIIIFLKNIGLKNEKINDICLKDYIELIEKATGMKWEEITG